jgi:lipid-binding SYLF domain-containing protein
MNSKFGRRAISALCLGIMICLAVTATPGQDYQQAYRVGAALERSADAAGVFRDFAVVRNKIPQDALLNAAAVGVFKGVFNPASISDYRKGDGAITVRTPTGWSAPVLYKMRGASVGLQAGDSPADYLLIFMSRESIRDIADGEFDLNLDANAVAGPILGAEGMAGHPEFPKSKTVFVYSRSKESIAGAVIEDARLMARDGVNRDLYGMDAFALLSDPSPLPNMCTACLTPGVSDFPTTVTTAIADTQPASVTVAQPQTTTRQYLALNRAAPRDRNRGVKVIVIRIIKDEDEDDDEDEDEDKVVVEVIDQPQPLPLRAINCCPRPHKRKL